MKKTDPSARPDEATGHGPGTVRLAVPWGRPSNFEHSKPGAGWDAETTEAQQSPGSTGGSADTYIRERTRLHETFIREQARTQRLGLILASLLIFLAAGVVIFAPAGRENISYWVGIALVVFAAGASGFGRIWGKTKTVSFGAGSDAQQSSENRNNS